MTITRARQSDGDDVGDDDERVAAVAARQRALCCAPRARSRAPRRSARGSRRRSPWTSRPGAICFIEPQDRPEVLHVGAHRSGDAGVLDLDRDVAPSSRRALVDLTDRRRGDRDRVEGREHAVDRLAELALDDLLHVARTRPWAPSRAAGRASPGPPRGTPAGRPTSSERHHLAEPSSPRPSSSPARATICWAASSWRRRARRCRVVRGAPEVRRAGAALTARPARREAPDARACAPAARSGIPVVGPRRAAARAGQPALDLRAGNDVVAAVGPADPRLVAAVVVVAEQHERRGLADRRARLVALGIEPAPHADERVCLALLADRRRVGVAGADDGLRRQPISVPMIDAVQVLVVVLPGAPTPPTEFLNSVSPVKTCPRRAATASRACGPACAAASTSRSPTVTGSPGASSPVAPGTNSRSLAWIRTSMSGPALEQRASSMTWSPWWWVSRTWVGVMPCSSAASISGSHRAAGVDEEPDPPVLADEVRVRQELRVHASAREPW